VSEADVDLRGTFQASEEETGSAEQDERHGDLRATRKLRRLQRRPGRARTSSPLSALGIRGREALHAGAKPQTKPAKRLRRKDALEKELAEKLRACGSESESHRHLALTLRSLREKIGNVGARDAEDEKRDGGECGDESSRAFCHAGRRIGGSIWKRLFLSLSGCAWQRAQR